MEPAEKRDFVTQERAQRLAKQERLLSDSGPAYSYDPDHTLAQVRDQFDSLGPVRVALLLATFSRPLLEAGIKLLISRDRPDFDRLVTGTGYSFPSGHVMAAVALWGLMPLVVSLYTRRRWLWWLSVAVSGGVILGIAVSRVYLGVHWFSDVTAGLIVGTFFLLAVETLLARQHTRYPCGQLSATSSPAVTGRWSDSPENSSNPSSPGRGSEALVTSTPSDA